MATFVQLGDAGREKTPPRLREDLRRRHPRATAATEFGAALGALGVTQRRAAQWFGVSPRHIRRWKSGTRHVPHAVVIVCNLLAMGAVTIEQVEAAAPAPGSAVPEPPASLLVEPAPEQPTLAPAEAATVADSSLAAKVLALGPASCRWPYGDPGHPSFCFCGAPAAEPPYCGRHRSTAYLAPRPQQAPVGEPSRLPRKFGYHLPAARQIQTVTRVPTLSSVCTQPPDLGTTRACSVPIESRRFSEGEG